MKVDFSSVKVQADYIEFNGGLNQINTLINCPPGNIVDGNNFECDTNGGYKRIAGYERFDGRTSPHTALFYSATFNNAGPGSLVAGATITGATSGATGVLIAYSVTQLFITKVTGTFQSAEDVTISGTKVATLTSTFGLYGAPSALLEAQYKVLAANAYRVDIQAVPGSGSILGIWTLADTVYAFRANAGASAVAMYKSSAAGWVLVPFEYEISFTNANVNVTEGDTLTKGVVTATIKRVVLQTGTLASGTNTGRLIISAPTGGSFSAGAATSTGSGTLTLAGAETAITLSVSAASRFEFYNYAFANTMKMYGCDSVNRGFEYGPNSLGENVFTPIVTGMSPDVPSHVACHRNYLFYSFGTSVQFSGLISPYQWTVITGGGELNAGDTVTALLPQIGSDNSASMMIFCRNQISVMYGTSSANFTRQVLRDGIGCMPYSAQNIGVALALDDRGIIMMGPTLNWGNFDQGTISKIYNDYLFNKKPRTSASSVNRGKNQFRVFFNDGSGIYVTVFQGNPIGAVPVEFDHPVKCIVEDEFSSGEERTFFGSTDGFVYELDVGPNFDGSNLNAFISLPFNSKSSPRHKKRFRKVVLDGRFTNYTELMYGYSLGYGKSEIMQPNNQNIQMSDGFSTWDTSFWDTMVWDGGFTPSEVTLDGSAENIQFIFQNNVNYVEPFVLTGVILHYNVRRLLR